MYVELCFTVIINPGGTPGIITSQQIWGRRTRPLNIEDKNTINTPLQKQIFNQKIIDDYQNVLL